MAHEEGATLLIHLISQEHEFSPEPRSFFQNNYLFIFQLVK